MKVYIVYVSFYEDCEWEILRIFDSEDKAKNYLEENSEDWEGPNVEKFDYLVEEVH